MKLDETVPIRCLPIIVNADHAEALGRKEKDPFYLAAYLIDCWMGDLYFRAAAEYAEKKNPRDRSLQTGEAWRGFLENFQLATAGGFTYLLSCFFRFRASDDSSRNSLRHAVVPLGVEHRCTGSYFIPDSIQTARLATPATRSARLPLLLWRSGLGRGGPFTLRFLPEVQKPVDGSLITGYSQPMKSALRSSRKHKVNFQSESFTLSHAKTYLGRLVEKAGKGETVYIVRGQQRVLLQPVPPIDPIPIRPPGYFEGCYSKAEIQQENRLAKASVVRAPRDLE